MTDQPLPERLRDLRTTLSVEMLVGEVATTPTTNRLVDALDEAAARLDALEAKLLAIVDRPSVGVDTSEDAARSVRTTVDRSRWRVMRTLADYGPTTAFTIAERIERGVNAVCPRLRELETLMWVEREPDRVMNPTGRTAHPYKLTPEGYARMVEWENENLTPLETGI